MKIASIALAVALITSCPTYAGDEMSVEGSGVAPCSGWLESHSNPAVNGKYREWVLGFVTAHNYYSTRAESQANQGTATWAFMDSYCRKNPNSALFAAAAALVQTTGGTKAKHIWKK